MYHYKELPKLPIDDNNSLQIQHDTVEPALKQQTTDTVHVNYMQRLMQRKVWLLSLLILSSYTMCVVLWYSGGAGSERVLACYYNTPDNNGSLLPAHIPPTLCTHINVAFASVRDKLLHLEPAQHDSVRQVVALKARNPSLKVLLSVGGAGQNNGFSEMVVDHASRKIFIGSLKSTMRELGLDGVDLDWEFPALHARAAAARERQHFSQLLREIRAEWTRERRPYLLTVAVAAPRAVVDVSYDVDQIDLYVDYANVMTYDYHYYSRFTPFTGLNSPLYPRAGETLYPATLNVDRTVAMYLERGLRADKIVVGVPTYGHSFTLVNEDNPAVGAPASGYGAVGGRGFVDYGAVCALVGGGATLRRDEAARVPYLYRGADWLSYESERSAADKARYAAARRLRGAMLYSLNADDHAGGCGGAPFPLSRAVAAALRAAP